MSALIATLFAPAVGTGLKRAAGSYVLTIACVLVTPQLFKLSCRYLATRILPVWEVVTAEEVQLAGASEVAYGVRYLPAD